MLQVVRLDVELRRDLGDRQFFGAPGDVDVGQVAGGWSVRHGVADWGDGAEASGQKSVVSRRRAVGEMRRGDVEEDEASVACVSNDVHRWSEIHHKTPIVRHTQPRILSNRLPPTFVTHRNPAPA